MKTTMSTHTPGPWNYRVARNGTHWISTDEWTRDFSEFPADARLIAAAPEMLEALQAILPILEHDGIECRNIRTIIAKATGE